MFYRNSLAVLVVAISPFLAFSPSAHADTTTTDTDEPSLSSMAKALEINRYAVALRLSQKQLLADKSDGAPKDVIDSDLADLRSKESAFHRVAGLD